ncbi:MAG: hypothetical protein ACJAUP_002851 [Cellvibrionaceae bacterium]|jgi:hypothetical protein
MGTYISQLFTYRNNIYRLLMATIVFTTALINVPDVNAENKITRPVIIYKSPDCGCCGAWVDHIEAAGFSTKIQHPENLNKIKEQLDISPMYQACHTAVTQGYVFEGHIPAEVIQHFINFKPDATGLSVPGMPLGSPGMETDKKFRSYEILQLNKDGASTPYARVSSSEIDYLNKK